jgi:hypothetical protein
MRTTQVKCARRKKVGSLLSNLYGVFTSERTSAARIFITGHASDASKGRRFRRVANDVRQRG